MTDPILLATLLLALGGAGGLCAALISHRRHARRLEARIHESVHLYAVVRAYFAERRTPIGG